MTQEEMLLEAAQTGFDSYYSVLGIDLWIAENFEYRCLKLWCCYFLYNLN